MGGSGIALSATVGQKPGRLLSRQFIVHAIFVTFKAESAKVTGAAAASAGAGTGPAGAAADGTKAAPVASADAPQIALRIEEVAASAASLAAGKAWQCGLRGESVAAAEIAPDAARSSDSSALGGTVVKANMSGIYMDACGACARLKSLHDIVGGALGALV